MIDVTLQRAKDHMRGHPRAEGLEVKRDDDGPYLLLTFHPDATQAEKDAAEAHADAFVFSPTLDEAWLRNQLRRRARELFDSDDPSPLLLRAAVVELLVEIDRLRNRLPPRTPDQVFDAIRSRSGGVIS